MAKRVYVDNSVIGGIHDEEFSKHSEALFREFRIGLYIPVISDITESEILGAPEQVKKSFYDLKAFSEFIEPTVEAFVLARRYLKEGNLTDRMMSDCLHIATASVHMVNIMASWNFRDIVNVNKIIIFHAVNLKMGYPLIEIRSPRELLHEENI